MHGCAIIAQHYWELPIIILQIMFVPIMKQDVKEIQLLEKCILVALFQHKRV